MKLNLTYMSGAGNFFSVLDNRQKMLTLDQASLLAPQLCNADGNGVITEGLMLLQEDNEENDFDCIFFNPDGSTGMMCGNGARCIVAFAREVGATYRTGKIKFSMANNTYIADFTDKGVRVHLPKPIEIRLNENIMAHKQEIPYSYSNVGSDHFVHKADFSTLDTFRNFNLIDWAKPIRNNLEVFPNGTNVNVYFVESESHLHLRTYERGVEAETGACGTGAISTALVSALKGETKLPVKITPTSGIPIYVNIMGTLDNIEEIFLEGPAEIIATKEVNVNL